MGKTPLSPSPSHLEDIRPCYSSLARPGPPSCLYLFHLETESGIPYVHLALLFTKSWGKQQRKPQDQNNSVYTNVPQWVRIPPTSARCFLGAKVLLPAVTQAEEGAVFRPVQSAAPLEQVGGARLREVMVVSTLSGCLGGSCFPCLSWSLVYSLCTAVIRTGCGSRRQNSGDPGNLEMVSVWSPCRN